MKPTIIIIPGSWHTTYHAQPLVDILEKRGYRAQAHKLAMTGGTPDGKGRHFEDDVSVIHDAVTVELDAGHDVCLVVHSYAGMSGSETVNRLLFKGRVGEPASDGKGRLVHVVYIAAYAFPAGFVLDAKDFGREDGRFGVSDDEVPMNTMTEPGKVFFNDIEDDAEVAGWVDALQPAYYQDRTPCITSDAWRSAPLTVVGCRRDNAIPPERQEMVWQGFEMKWLDAGHTPYVSRPGIVAELIEQALSVR